MEKSYESERAHGEKLRWNSGEQEVPQNSICYFFFQMMQVCLSSVHNLVVLFMSQVSAEPLEYNDCINKHVSSRITCVSARNKEHSGCSELH